MTVFDPIIVKSFNILGFDPVFFLLSSSLSIYSIIWFSNIPFKNLSFIQKNCFFFQKFQFYSKILFSFKKTVFFQKFQFHSKILFSFKKPVFIQKPQFHSQILHLFKKLFFIQNFIFIQELFSWFMQTWYRIVT